MNHLYEHLSGHCLSHKLNLVDYSVIPVAIMKVISHYFLVFATYDDSHVFTKYRIWYVKHEHLSGHCSDGC